MDNKAAGYDLHRFESAAERLEFIDCILADNQYLLPIAEHLEGGVRGQNPTQRESKAINECLASILLFDESNLAVHRYQILSSGK